MNPSKKTNGPWPTAVEITAQILVLSAEVSEELKLKFSTSSEEVQNLANLVSISYDGHNRKILRKNALSFMEALQDH